MRRLAQIVVTSEESILKEVISIVCDEAEESKIFSNKAKVIIYEELESYKCLLKFLSDNNLFYTFAEAREYTKKEMKDAKFFHCVTPYPWELDAKNAEDYGTKYSYNNVCSKCGFGKKQISELVINIKKIKKYNIAQIIPEFVVTEYAKQIIVDNNLLGCEFRPVRDYKGRTEPILYQMIITNILPPMSNETRFEIWEASHCFSCDTNGRYQRSEFVYDLNSLENALDFNLTHEYIGNTNFMQRQLIISARARSILNENKIKSIVYEPVRIVI